MAVLVIVVAGAAVAFSAMSDDSDGDIIDGLGRKVKVESSDRIASTSATVTEVICGLADILSLPGSPRITTHTV
ncbi:MAG: hypothetical protein LBB30_01230 [Candidatus Methanoplasma sp.]|nr:hypothetical protein [Candidatus Methanoplasma sp.]